MTDFIVYVPKKIHQMNMEKKKKIHLKLDTDLRAVHKSLNRNGLNGRVDVKKPLLTTGKEIGGKAMVR